jgi:LmbE family N-acetylglucosaminyl deacetylase
MKENPPKIAEKWLDLLPGTPVARMVVSGDILVVTGTRDHFPEMPGEYDRIFLPMDEEWARWQRWYFQCFSRQLRVGGFLCLVPQPLRRLEGSTWLQLCRQGISRLRRRLAARSGFKRFGRILVPVALRGSAADHGLQLAVLRWRELILPPAICFWKQNAALAQKPSLSTEELAATAQQYFGAWCDASGLQPSISGAKLVGVESLMTGKVGASVLVLSPHPDDELIGCGGTLLQLAELGAGIHVVQMTEGATCHALRGASVAEKRSIRWEEAKEVGRRFGFRCHFWSTGADYKLADNELTRDLLRDLLQDLKPSLIFVPSASDLHPEHRVASSLLRATIEFIPHAATVLEYPVWGLLPAASHAVEVTRSYPQVLDALYLYRTAMKAEDYVSRCRVLALFHGNRFLGSGCRQVELFCLIKP